MARYRMTLLRPLAAATACIAGPISAAAPTVHNIDPVHLEDGSTAGITIRLTFPDRHASKLPVIILSHGNRLSRSDYQPIVQALGQAGYLVVQPDHDDASIDGFPPTAPQRADLWRTRIDQLRWIAGHLKAIERVAKPLRGVIDSNHIAVLGHSFGGHTVALAMGATVLAPDTGKVEDYAIAGLRGAVLLAPPGHFDGLVPVWKARAPYLRVNWATMRGPVLTITGDSDDSMMTGQGPTWHQNAWQRAVSGQNMCLMQVPGGHYLGGIDSPLRLPAGDATPERRAHVTAAIVAFFDRIMGRSNGAERWAALRPAPLCK